MMIMIKVVLKLLIHCILQSFRLYIVLCSPLSDEIFPFYSSHWSFRFASYGLLPIYFYLMLSIIYYNTAMCKFVIVRLSRMVDGKQRIQGMQ